MRWLTLATVVFGISVVAPDNLVKNPGFEAASGWEAPGPVWSYDSMVTHGGGKALKYKNSDPDLYVLAVQRLPAAPKTAYRVRVWIRTEDVTGPDSGGATVALEWRDAEGHFLGGFYPKGFTGTNDWRELEEVSPLSPSNVASVAVVCYLRKGCTGAAWFDDVSVEPVAQSRFRVTVLEPWLRGSLDGNDTVRVRAELPKTWENGASIRATLSGGGQKVTRTARAQEGGITLRLPVPAGPKGDYQLRVEWVGADGVVKEGREETLHATAKAPAFVGRTLLVDGKPFFPLGTYESQGWKEEETPKRLKEIADAGFNCVLPYGILDGNAQGIRKYLDTAQKNGLKVILSLKDLYSHSRYKPSSFEGQTQLSGILEKVVTEFRNHPALFAWYINDESGPEYWDSLRANYERVIALDPVHPCYSVINQPESAADYVGTFDVIGVDPYPVPGSPLTLVADWMAGAATIGRPMWTVVQIFDKTDYQPGVKLRPPTEDEIRAMAFLALAEGANGLMMYSYYNLKAHDDFTRRWAEVGKVCRELQRLTPIVASGEPIALDGASGHVGAWKHEGKLYFLAVNPKSTETSVKLTLPGGYQVAQTLLGPTATGANVTVKLPPSGVGLYVCEGAAAGR